jgi:uroporphyrinogen III methyltransferase / synthase
MSNDCAKVYLVGAGPGDSGLFTLRGAELLARADVVVTDRLVSPEVLQLASPQAERIDVGKRSGSHAMTQNEINDLLVRLAREGRCVVRLKGGDPFVFGRGGEEADALVEAGIAYEIVPGVTSGIAGPAYAGIPVTHRGLSSAVVLVTGHEDPTKAESDLDYDALARIGTVVVYMGVGRLADLASRMIEAGRSPDTPAAVIERATTCRQRTVRAPLGDLASVAERSGVAPPAIIVMGQTVALEGRLAWCDSRPLSGKRIVVTRTREQASRLSALLRDLGAGVLEVPTLAVEPIRNRELDAAVERLSEYHWLVLTSPNAVARFFEVLAERSKDARGLAGVRVAAIGPGTAAALLDGGVRADLVPPEAIGESLAEGLMAAGAGKGTRILLPGSEAARDVLPAALRSAGAVVDVIATYRTVPPEPDADAMAAVLDGDVDLVTLTSSSTAEHFARLIEGAGGDAAARARERLAFAAIGPVTGAAARGLGFRVVVESREYTLGGLVRAIECWAQGASGD